MSWTDIFMLTVGSILIFLGINAIQSQEKTTTQHPQKVPSLYTKDAQEVYNNLMGADTRLQGAS